MKRRGISPLIATVLLIGFTIVLAALVMKWGGELFQSTTTTQGCAAESRLECASDVDISITAVKQGEWIVGTGGTLKVSITSQTNRQIDGYWIISYKTDGTTFADPGTKKYTETISSFATIDELVNFSASLLDQDVTKVEVIPIIVHTQSDGTTCTTECSEKTRTVINIPIATP